MHRKFSSLIDDLLKAECLEEAATCCLTLIMEIATETLEKSQFAGQGKIRRVMTHLRPSGSYRSLLLLEAGTDQVRVPEGDLSLLPSATTWSKVEEHRCAVGVDVYLACLELLSADGGKGEWEPGYQEQGLIPDESRVRLMNREVSHLCAIPLRLRGGKVGGMISIEADCRIAMGQDFIWRDRLAHLQFVADVAAWHLCTLGLRRKESLEVDKYLPVIGQTMTPTIQLLRVFARQNETLLLSGPTGSGKSRLARWCHEHSSRSGKKFIKLDLSTIPETLQMSELFGWKKGAFTGAISSRDGMVAQARGGTLFIDEIDKLSLSAQSGLLQLLEERTFHALGDKEGLIEADTRFIVGTNAKLEEAVKRGDFRQDLYFRINVLAIELPSLRDRADEIPAWADYMLKKRHREDSEKGTARFSQEAVTLLLEQAWPGNLRQLENLIRRAYLIALAESGVVPEDMELGKIHVERALKREGQGKEIAIIAAMKSAARAILEEAERRSEEDEPLSLAVADSLRGMVLYLACQKYERPDVVFRLFGEERLVKNRNHHKTFGRERSKLARLFELLDEEPWPGLDCIAKKE